MANRTQAPRLVDRPEPGCFLIKLVSGGPFVPGRIVVEGGKWHAVVNGKAYPPATDPLEAPWVSRLWLGDRITRDEYERRLALRDIPGHPAGRPNERISLATATPPVF
jgi:hypothetical protein